MITNTKFFVISTFLVAASAFAAESTTPSHVVDAAARFGLPSGIELKGKDSRGRYCEVDVRLDVHHIGVDGTTFYSADAVKTANVSVYRSAGSDMEVKKLRVEGDLAYGRFTVKFQEKVEAHKTDFGLMVPSYSIDYEAELVFKRGKLVKADVRKSRPGLSKFVFDPDYQGGSVKDCTTSEE